MEILTAYINAERGRLAAICRLLNLKPQTVGAWKKVPSIYCLDIEQFTGISRHDLRPDVYGPKEK